MQAPRALFLFPDGNIYPDNLVCSGVLSPDGLPCPYSDHGRFPELITVNVNAPGYEPGRGRSGDRSPPAPNTTSVTSAIGKITMTKPSQRTCCPCDCSNAKCGFGWWCWDCMRAIPPKLNDL